MTDAEREEYEWEKAVQQTKRRVRKLAISAMVAARLAEHDPLRKKPGRPRKAREA